MILQGNVNVFLDCIGRSIPDKKILDALKSRDPEISRTCAMEHIREVMEFILDKYKKKAR